MAHNDFLRELLELNLDAVDLGEGRFVFPFCVQTGRFAGATLSMGLITPPSYNLDAPSGIHITPKLLPHASGGVHPSGGIHDSAFGPEWQYWSRPLHHWVKTNRTARDVLAHVRHLFDTQ